MKKLILPAGSVNAMMAILHFGGIRADQETTQKHVALKKHLNKVLEAKTTDPTKTNKELMGWLEVEPDLKELGELEEFLDPEDLPPVPNGVERPKVKIELHIEDGYADTLKSALKLYSAWSSSDVWSQILLKQLHAWPSKEHEV